jgi:uncharacterized protein YndB with AHSA1/START domain
MIRWWGVTGHAKPPIAETDLRVGGRFNVQFWTPDGAHQSVSGVYREVVPDEKLVFTWAWRGKPEWESQVTVALRRDGDATMLTLTHEELPDDAERDGHRTGWTGALDKLEKLFA